MKICYAAPLAAMGVIFVSSAFAGETLDKIRGREVLACGVSQGVAGFSQPDSKGYFTGLDVDVCRAISAAILGAADKVKYTPLSAAARFTALQSGEVDILSRNSAWTLTREASLGLLFGPVDYYDGQGFMVTKKSGIKSAKQLSGASVCVQPGTTTELNLADYARANNLQINPVVIENRDELEDAFFSGRCDALTTDASGLAGTRSAKASNPDDYVILPEVISKEPMAPSVRKGDDQFYDVMRWTVEALIEAEERGITSANADEMLKSQDPAIKRLLGVTPGNGKALGLDEQWAYRAIKQVGNYGEIFERNVGSKSTLKLARGLNDLWTVGGLMYAAPAR